MNIKILEWNVKCAAGNSQYGRSSLIPLLSEIPMCDEKPKHDILVLTEFYRCDDYVEFEKMIKSWGYVPFITPKQEQTKKEKYNSIFIAVSETFSPELVEYTDKGTGCFDRPRYPDFLAIKMQSNGKNLTVAGVRFFGSDKDMKASYDEMAAQFENFLPIVNCFESAVIAGDFNNGKIYGDENAKYTENEIVWEYAERAHINYNYHRIKLRLAQNSYSLATPPQGFSYPYKPPCVGGSKIDHFAVKGIGIENVKYLSAQSSDHNKLTGEIVIPNTRLAS
jgi:hypothetical protein